MTLSLNRWYRIAFPSQPHPVSIFVTVTEEDPMEVEPDCFYVELQSSTDLNIEKVRLTSQSGETLAICSNGIGCVGGAVEPLDIEADILYQAVWSPDIVGQDEWMPYDPATGLQTLRLYFSLIPESDEVQPCNDNQPELAVEKDDPARGTVAAFPMVFAFPGEEQPERPGKLVKVIWKKDL